MSCNGNVESGIVGVAYDGFPFYGPMQYYSGKSFFTFNLIDLLRPQIKKEKEKSTRIPQNAPIAS